MPFVRVGMLEGRSPNGIKALLDETERTVVAAFNVPQRDRYQVVHEHPASHFIVEDTGLGIARTRNCVFFHVTTRGRHRRRRRNFTTCYAASWRQRAA
ncbi:MAG TPA: tautomerase family protein [Terriglobales bacterium]